MICIYSLLLLVNGRLQVTVTYSSRGTLNRLIAQQYATHSMTSYICIAHIHILLMLLYHITHISRIYNRYEEPKPKPEQAGWMEYMI